MRKILLYISFFAILVSCSSGHDNYSGYVNIRSGQWLYNDTISYDINITDTTLFGEFTIGIRHNNYYPYRNIWIELTCTDSNNVVYSRDSINMELCDIYGRWHGNGIGSSYQLRQELPKHIQFRAKSKLLLRHVMRVDTLEGIEQLGFIFNSTNL